MNAADALLENKAKAVYAYISHGVLSGGAAKRIANSRLKELVITELDPAGKGNSGRREYSYTGNRIVDRRSYRPHCRRGVGIEPV